MSNLLDELNAILESTDEYTPTLMVMYEVVDQLMLEKTFDIQEDIDFLYERLGIKAFCELYRRDPEAGYRAYNANFNDIVAQIPSSELKSSQALEANGKIPVEISFGMGNGGNMYKFNEGKIIFNMNRDALNVLGAKGLTSAAINMYGGIENEFDEHRWKGVIAHELTHWMEDALYSGKVRKIGSKQFAAIQKAKKRHAEVESDFSHVSDRRQKEVERSIVRLRNTSASEIESFIAQIKQRKDAYGDARWNNLTFKDLFKKDNSLNTSFRNAKEALFPAEFKRFVNTMVRKMDREGLLGKNMRNPDRDTN